jgi:hypothetical protein
MLVLEGPGARKTVGLTTVYDKIGKGDRNEAPGLNDFFNKRIAKATRQLKVFSFFKYRLKSSEHTRTISFGFDQRFPNIFEVSICMHYRYTDKKENQILLIYQEIQNGAVAKSHVTKGLLIYGEVFAYFLIY